MTQYLRQSTAATLKLGPFVDAAGAAATGLTISQADVRLTKNGGNMAQKNESTACTHDEIGFYDCPVDTTDTNTLGRLDVMVAESGAQIVVQGFSVIPATIYDQMFAASFPRGTVLASGTLGATGNTTTALHLTGLAYGDDEINGNMIVIHDVSTGLVYSTYITDFANTGDLATVPTLPFTPQASTDTYVVLAAKKDPDVATILADTNDIQTRLPAALVGGRMDASVGAVAAGAIDAAAIANGAIDAATFAADVDAEILSYLVDDATRIDASALNTASVTSIPAILADTGTDGVVVAAASKSGYALSATGVAALTGTVPARLKKNTAFTGFPIKMELTDGSPGTGLTVTVQRAIGTGAFAALAVTTVTEKSGGWYTFDFAASDLNGDAIAVKCTATGAKQLDFLIITQVAA